MDIPPLRCNYAGSNIQCMGKSLVSEAYPTALCPRSPHASTPRDAMRAAARVKGRTSFILSHCDEIRDRSKDAGLQAVDKKEGVYIPWGHTLIKNDVSHLVRTATLGLRTLACDTSHFDSPIVKPQGSFLGSCTSHLFLMRVTSR